MSTPSLFLCLRISYMSTVFTLFLSLPVSLQLLPSPPLPLSFLRTLSFDAKTFLSLKSSPAMLWPSPPDFRDSTAHDKDRQDLFSQWWEQAQILRCPWSTCSHYWKHACFWTMGQKKEDILSLSKHLERVMSHKFIKVGCHRGDDGKADGRVCSIAETFLVLVLWLHPELLSSAQIWVHLPQSVNETRVDSATLHSLKHLSGPWTQPGKSVKAEGDSPGLWACPDTVLSCDYCSNTLLLLKIDFRKNNRYKSPSSPQQCSLGIITYSFWYIFPEIYGSVFCLLYLQEFYS